MIRNRPVLVAEMGAPHGIKGEVRVKCHLSDPLALGTYGPLWDEGGQEYDVVSARPSKSVLIVRFDGVNDRNMAAALKGKRLYVDRSEFGELVAEDEYFHADLIGLDVVDTKGELCGRLVAIHDFGAGDIVEIETQDGGDLMVPFTRACVPDIALDARRITIEPPLEISGEPSEAEQSEPRVDRPTDKGKGDFE